MPQHSAPGHDIIVVGSSAGGVEALAQLASGLPDGLPAAVFAVLHLPPQAPNHLSQILMRYGPLPASQPRDGEPIRHGRIYVAPPDFHLMVERGRVRVTLRVTLEASGRPGAARRSAASLRRRRGAGHAGRER